LLPDPRHCGKGLYTPHTTRHNKDKKRSISKYRVVSCGVVSVGNRRTVNAHLKFSNMVECLFGKLFYNPFTPHLLFNETVLHFCCKLPRNLPVSGAHAYTILEGSEAVCFQVPYSVALLLHICFILFICLEH
jgi:hypothetical protein